MPAELPPSIAFMLDEFRGEKFTLEDVSKSLSDKAFVRDFFDQCLASIGTFKYADDIQAIPGLLHCVEERWGSRGMHLYAQGGHAFGLRRTKFPVTRWPELVETWLETIGMIGEYSAREAHIAEQAAPLKAR
jgi:hypothetical protein